MEKSVRHLSLKSEIAGAIRYLPSRWRTLTRMVDDGRLEIDNNSAERTLCVVALGRKNLPVRRLRCRRTVLDRIAEHPINRTSDLLPWNPAARLQTQTRHAA